MDVMNRIGLAVGLTLLGGIVLLAGGAALFVTSGVYEVAADRPHMQAVHDLLETTMGRSVQRRAAAIEERPLQAAVLVERGAVCFRQHCMACHGAPAVSAEPLALAMQPVPGPLVDAARRWRARELVWIVRHGIRMSGMPAWGQRLYDDDIWALAAYMQALSGLSPQAHAQLQQRLEGGRCEPTPPAQRKPLLTGGAPVDLAQAGRVLLQQRACHACHQIPGVVGSRTHVGPSLSGFGRQQLIAGRLPNTPDQLARWIVQPQHVDPGTAMPDSGIGMAEAEAMAAYLSALR
jgi:mono/diheme cytochrome c family protein